jgi:uncharacterized protein (TIGR03663 family)
MSFSTHDQPETLPHTTLDLSWLTIEMALYAALAFIAFLIRFLTLDGVPLNTDEAQQAIASLDFVRGAPSSFTGSPLLFTGNAILFALFGATDLAARLLPALFGSVLILLPALFRHEIGRIGALIASTLLVFSPSLVFFSRTTNGSIMAITCALAALGFSWRYLIERQPRHLNLAAILAALALLSAREVWTVVVALIVFVIVMRDWLSLGNNGEAHSRNHLRFAALLFVSIFVGIGTTFLMHREGLGAAFDLFGAWLGGLQPSIAITDPLYLLFIYEPIILFFGIAAVMQFAFTPATDETPIPLALFALWSGIAFVLYSIGADKNPARIVALTVPLGLMAGWYLGLWLERAAVSTERETFLAQELPLGLIALIIAAFLFIIIAELATRGSVNAADVLAAAAGVRNASGFLVIMLITLALATMSFLIIVSVGLPRALDVGLAIVLAILAIWTIRQMTMLNFPAGGALNEQEYLVTRVASANVRDFVFDVKDISRWRANDSHTLNIVADESLGPMLAWYLRDFRNLNFSARPTIAPNTQALLLPITAPPPASNWMSQTYQLEIARGAGDYGALHRLIFRDLGERQSANVVLWIPITKE